MAERLTDPTSRLSKYDFRISDLRDLAHALHCDDWAYNDIVLCKWAADRIERLEAERDTAQAEVKRLTDEQNDWLATLSDDECNTLERIRVAEAEVKRLQNEVAELEAALACREEIEQSNHAEGE